MTPGKFLERCRADGACVRACATAQKTSHSTSSGSGGRGHGGLSFVDARSMERSLGSEGSPGSSMVQEGMDDLAGVPQANLEKHQQQFVRYSGLSEGGAARACDQPTHIVAPRMPLRVGSRLLT